MVVIAAIAAIPIWAIAQTAAQPSLIDSVPDKFTRNASRPCLYQAEGWTTIDSDNSGDNDSAELTSWTTYVIQCTSDAYIAWGDSTVAADSSDGWIAGGAWIRFMTDATNVYVSVLNVTHATDDCHYIECK